MGILPIPAHHLKAKYNYFEASALANQQGSLFVVVGQTFKVCRFEV
jgi:hypothetical protein